MSHLNTDYSDYSDTDYSTSAGPVISVKFNVLL